MIQIMLAYKLLDIYGIEMWVYGSQHLAIDGKSKDVITSIHCGIKWRDGNSMLA